MAVTVNIYYTGTDGGAVGFAREMTESGIVSDIRAEKGNIKYDYFVSFDNPETVLLVDRWESQKAIDRHHASPMMKKITELREKYNLTMKVERYIDDENGIPEIDRKFIR
ncbi:MAG: antibiotic biosynthesis monooxygenase [Ruminococcus sp.]|nr:antibiotic biosynthesis monooxygenase [Ruminococcus sp.]